MNNYSTPVVVVNDSSISELSLSPPSTSSPSPTSSSPSPTLPSIDKRSTFTREMVNLTHKDFYAGRNQTKVPSMTCISCSTSGDTSLEFDLLQDKSPPNRIYNFNMLKAFMTEHLQRKECGKKKLVKYKIVFTRLLENVLRNNGLDEKKRKK